MISVFELISGAITAVFLIGYLFYALVNAEKF